MDERDVVNLMRHMFLIGCNTVLEGTDKDDEKFLDRDEAIESFLEEQMINGFTDYGCDLGSQGHCPPECDQ